MDKKQIALLVLLVAACVGVAWAVVYKYDHRAKVPQGITIQQALNERQDALKTLALHDGVNKANLDTANTKINQQQSTIGTLCAQIKAAKLVQPLCQ